MFECLIAYRYLVVCISVVWGDNCSIDVLFGGSNVWMLKLTDPQLKDSGEYECQVSYHDDVEKKLKMPFALLVLGK